MSISKGSKMKLITPMFGHEAGEICTVTDINAERELISYSYDDSNADGMMSISLLDHYFEEVEEPENEELITFDEYIDEIMSGSEIESYTIYGKCMVVHCKLPNGYVLVESYDWVIPEEYDEEIAYDICMDKIEDKVRELEMYNIQKEMYVESMQCPCNGCEQ